MNSYIVLLALTGVLMLAVAALPLVVRELPLSSAVILLVTGGIAALFSYDDVWPLPWQHAEVTERLTEFVVIVSLMGAGLKLDTSFGWRRWSVTWRLLGIAMPLSIAGIALLGWGVLGMAPAAALLLGAALAPTDPVLASDVQVGPPGEGGEDSVRFALTSEAGLNDGLAFPFVNLAILLAVPATTTDLWAHWLLVDVIWKLAAGIAVGWLAGRMAGWLLFRLPYGPGLAASKDGFVAVGLTLLAYALTETLHGYGFVAVFVAALTLRASETGHHYHQRMHDFAEEIERLSLSTLLVFLGAAFVAGFLQHLTPLPVIVALAVLLVVRPLAGLASQAGSGDQLRARMAISFFGIRGVGSFYYVAYAVTAADFADEPMLWTVVTLVVVLSILIHGVLATPALAWVARGAREQRRAGTPAA